MIASRAGCIALVLALPAGVRAQDAGTLQIRDLTPGEVRMEAFQIEMPATLRIDAIGAESGGLNRLVRMRNAVVRLVSRVIDQDVPTFVEEWGATAWIIEAASREMVWRLDAMDTRESDRGLRSFEGELRLSAGTYEVFYASFPHTGGHDHHGPGWLYDRQAASKLRLDLEIEGAELLRVDPAERRARFEASNVIALGRSGGERHERVAFDVARPVDVDLYMVGEATRNRSYDHGWVIDADTREPVWAFDWVRSQPAGGASRNRVVRERLTLPAGRYAAFFSRDGSHGPGSWQALPPNDPAAWGLSIRPVSAADRDAFRTYEYQPVPEGQAIVSMTGVGHDATRSAGFILTRATDIRFFALGEGSDQAMHDAAWLENASTFEPVWTMEFEKTGHAGGAGKNRLFDGVVHLPAGTYIAHYSTDGSHAYDDWNGEPPMDPEFWGLTILPAREELTADMTLPYDRASDPAVIARVERVGSGHHVRRSFQLESDGDVRVYALGEGSSGEMYDYARIMDATGREVWRMRYEDTVHAGGSGKNRRVNTVLHLAAGAYDVIYRTDDSHAWDDWNSTRPSDPESWGVTVRRN